MAECEWSAEGGFAAAQELLKSKVPFTAVLAANDQIALGLMEAFWQKGIEIPRGMSIIGFDNMPESGFFRPPLTTINHDFNVLGATSLQIVAAAISNPDLPPSHHKIAPQLIIRESVSKI